MEIARRTFLASLAGAAAAQARRPPNVVFIVTDDHGYGDTSAYPHPPEVKTPQIDRIAREGVRFEAGYAGAYVCAPTRAQLLTGRYQQRFGFYTASDSREGLPLGETTLADLLRPAGYRTMAVGKWHLGIEPAYHPLKRGFDEFYGFLGHGAHDYFDLKPSSEPHQSIWRDGKPIADTGYLTDNLGREAAAFVARNEARPFFLYLAFNAVHFPLQAPPATVRKYDTGRRERDTYLAMLEHEDAAVGRVLDELKRRGLERDTLVAFVSDNGGARNNASNNGSLRDYKHSVYEGGIRVPYMIRWLGHAKAGTVCKDPVMTFDLFATAARAAGVSPPAGRVHDGKDLSAALEGRPRSPVHDRLFWDGDEEKRAVRMGRWKLVDNAGKLELFDLESDPSEKADLAARQPDRVRELKAEFDRWRAEMKPRIGKGGPEDEGGARKKGGRKKKKA